MIESIRIVIIMPLYRWLPRFDGIDVAEYQRLAARAVWRHPWLERSAVIQVDGVERLSHRPYPREVAVAHLGGSLSSCWLVEPDCRWSQMPATVAPHAPFPGSHVLGLKPVEFAASFQFDTAGVTLYAEASEAVGRWLQLVFDAAGASPVPQVRDIRELLQSVADNEELWVDAEAFSTNLALTSSRAAGDALRNAVFLLRLHSWSGIKPGEAER